MLLALFEPGWLTWLRLHLNLPYSRLITWLQFEGKVSMGKGGASAADKI